MAALSASRNTPVMGEGGLKASYPVQGSTHIYKGSMVVVDTGTGYAKPAAAATGLQSVGIALIEADNSAGADGAMNVEVQTVVARWVNGASITDTSIGATAYFTDDQTVNITSTGHSAACPIIQVDSAGVWVRVGQV